MFCPTCGTEYNIELNYCNRCGANLSVPVAAPPQGVSINLTSAVAAISTTLAVVTLGGFGAVIFGAIQLAKNTPMGTDPLMMMILLGLLTILTADVLLLRQLSRLISAALSSNNPQPVKRPAISAFTSNPSMPELARPVTARLEPGTSVTENTTRFFEPAPGYRRPTEVENEAPTNLKS